MAYPTKYYRALAKLNVQRSSAALVRAGMSLERVQEAMGSMATEQDAQAMLDLLEAQGIESPDDVEDSTWFQMVAQAIKKS